MQSIFWLNDLLTPAADDNIVDIRATARGRPGLRDSAIGLSFSDGLAYDRNTAKRKTELLRKARSPLADSP